MNLAQMRAHVRDILTAGGGQNTVITTDDFWSDAEINAALNKAQAEVYKVIRRSRGDYFTRILRTTDSALIIKGQSITPSELKIVAGVGNYQLPPDFVRMKLITDLTSQDRVRFVGTDLAKNEFRVLMNTEGGTTAREYLYDILGIRTLIIRPTPGEERDVEYIYEKSLESLRDWTEGSVTINNGSASANFSASADLQNRAKVGDELIVGTSGSAQATPDVSAHYPVVKSIDSSTQITLAGPYLGSSVTSYAYRLSSVSEIPPDHHWLLVAFAAAECFKKGTNPHLDAISLWQGEFDRMLPSLVNDIENRYEEIETVQPYLEDLYDA